MSANGLYDPDQSAVDTRWIQPWSETFRAQRDVGLRVPINYQTVPGVSLTAACFGENQFEHFAFKRCFSNLLAVGFRRFTVDTYWDPLRQVWSLCPVELPQANGGDANGAGAPLKTSQTVVQSSDTVRASAPMSNKTATSAICFCFASVFGTNQCSDSHHRRLSESRWTPNLQVGNYNCTSLTTLDLLTGILEDFLDATSTTTGAALVLLSFNVHVASSIANPNADAPRLSQGQLPGQGKLLSDILRGNLSDELYKPTNLADDRANLNNSWYDVEWNNQPVHGYYEGLVDAEGHLYTNIGWPTEAYMEFKKLFRLVASYGSIDSQMGDYNTTADSGYIFPTGTLSNQISTSVDSDGSVTSGCLFDPSSTNLSLLIPSITNLTRCGTSPFLNQTLANAPADRNPLPYAAFVHSTLCVNRCVVMTKSQYPSRWRTTDCREPHRVACHDPSSPYAWHLSPSTSPYETAESLCSAPSRFSVPHTTLETHTYNVVYINLNSINTPDCWVEGRNSTCPYLASTDTDRTRIVVVPTVAAIIIFVLAALTFFVKCAANRRIIGYRVEREWIERWGEM
ncbi:lectin C-type domain-containing protein [Bipolaris maydis]|nr:lectin C-type domain-containing protein [Bipolaris maydis]